MPRHRNQIPVDQRAWVEIPSERGNPLQQIGETRLVYPWWDKKPDSGQDFLIFASLLALGAGATITPAALLFTVNPGYQAVVKFVQIFVDAPTTSLDVTWTLLVNGAPVPGFAMQSFPRAATNLSLTFSGDIRVPVGSTISISISSVANAWTVGAQYGGWQVPIL